jgi:hypothetical protein
LENQRVHPEDSVLGPYSFSTPSALRPGLRTYYFTLVREAFNPKFWSSNKRGPLGAPPARPGGAQLAYSQLEANFGMFFALAARSRCPRCATSNSRGPYMHNGSMATLEEVVEFYARGGNFDSRSKQFGTVFP